MSDQLKCAIFHETDGSCCKDRKTCRHGDEFAYSIAPRVKWTVVDLEKKRAPLGPRAFLAILGLGILCYSVGLFIIIGWAEPRSVTYLPPLTRMLP